VKEEYGDLLFALVNLGRHLDVEPEAALEAANLKFFTRFRYIEKTPGLEGPERRRSHARRDGSALAGSQDSCERLSR
jgi:ATP diphosphatase